MKLICMSAAVVEVESYRVRIPKYADKAIPEDDLGCLI
jgi:hypothetical protein